MRHNEITAIRTAGVSLWRLSLPYFLTGILASAALFALDEFCVPKTATIAEKIRNRRVEQHLDPDAREKMKGFAFSNAREGRLWQAAAYNPHTGEMIRPRVDWRLPDGSWRSIFAQRAIRTNGVWTFYDVREFKTETTNSPPVKQPFREVETFPEFSETKAMIESDISISDSFDHPTSTRRADIPLSEIWNYLRLHPNPDPRIRPWLETKLQGRFAGPCACLVVILIGVPFAAAPGRRNVFVGVAASIFFFFLYYILQQIGFAYGEAGRIPAWLAAWLPNLAFGIAGLAMMMRIR